MEKATPKSSPITHTTHYSIEDQSVHDALLFIPASLPRDEWVKIAMALKSIGIPFEIFDNWSSTAPNYNSRDACVTWRSIVPTGGITIASLFHIAKQYGYDPRQSKANFKPLLERANQRQHKADKARQQAVEKARTLANKIIDGCGYAPSNHPYFVSKKITPTLPVWQYKQALVIPIMDITGEIHSLQFIKADGNKTFLKNGTIKGHFYQIWSRKKPSDAIVICEGYATGVTLASQYTPDCSVVVAFNAGNLKLVAETFRNAFVDAPIIIAGDRDTSGVGQQAAEEAALAVGGLISIPPFVEGELGSDWNDFWVNRMREVAA